MTGPITRREERVATAAYRALGGKDLGDVTVLLTPEAPESPMVNRVVGLGVAKPVTEELLDEALALIPAGTTFYVAVTPGAQPETLPSWLVGRGLEPGWGWMWFRREPGELPVESLLRVSPVDDDRSSKAFCRIVREGYGLPSAVDDALGRAIDAGWECMLAWDGDGPIGAAGLYVEERVAYLGFAATQAAHRGKGAQTVLLSARLRRARERDVELVVTETGELREGAPSNSYRNILRAGFQEVAVTANWLGHQ